jgi:hypothetical protein
VAPVRSVEGTAADELEQCRARTATTPPCGASRRGCQLRHGSPAFGSLRAGVLLFVPQTRPKQVRGSGMAHLKNRRSQPFLSSVARHSRAVAASTSNRVVGKHVPSALGDWDDVVSAEVDYRAAIGAVGMPGDCDHAQLLVHRVIASLAGRSLRCSTPSGLLTLIRLAAFIVGIAAVRGDTAAVTAETNGHGTTSPVA